MFRNSAREMLQPVFDQYSERNRGVLMRRFGLDGAEGCTLAKAGQEFHISKERVRQIEQRLVSDLHGIEDYKSLPGYQNIQRIHGRIRACLPCVETDLCEQLASESLVEPDMPLRTVLAICSMVGLNIDHSSRMVDGVRVLIGGDETEDIQKAITVAGRVGGRNGAIRLSDCFNLARVAERKDFIRAYFQTPTRGIVLVGNGEWAIVKIHVRRFERRLDKIFSVFASCATDDVYQALERTLRRRYGGDENAIDNWAYKAEFPTRDVLLEIMEVACGYQLTRGRIVASNGVEGDDPNEADLTEIESKVLCYLADKRGNRAKRAELRKDALGVPVANPPVVGVPVLAVHVLQPADSALQRQRWERVPRPVQADRRPEG